MKTIPTAVGLVAAFFSTLFVAAGEDSKSLGAPEIPPPVIRPSLVETNGPAEQRLRPGDHVSVTVLVSGIDSSEIRTRVSSDGLLKLPPDLKVAVKGKTLDQLKKEITDLLVPEYFRHVRVTIKRIPPDQAE